MKKNIIIGIVSIVLLIFFSSSFLFTTYAYNWSVEEEQDPLTDEKNIYISVRSNEYPFTQAFLVVRFIKSHGSPEIFIVFNESLDNSLIIYRIDDEEAIQENWHLNEDLVATYFPKDFAKKLIDSEELIIGYYPEGRIRQNVSFNISDFNEAIAPYLSDFGWDDIKVEASKLETSEVDSFISFAGGSGTVDDPYLIDSPEQLNAIRDNLKKHFKLIANIDLGNYSSSNGWEPIGNYYEDKDHDLYKPFTGTLDGNGYKINNLYISRPDENNVGLFSFVGEKGEIKNVYLENIYVEGNNSVGGLSGTNFSKEINNISLKGEITGSNIIGGLFGLNSSSLKNLYVDINIIGEDDVGGLIGNNIGDINGAIVDGEVYGRNRVGGVIGNNFDGEHNLLISTTNVKGESNFVGGIIGEMTSGYLSYNYSFGNIEGIDSVGGVLGHIILGEIHDSQYRGNVNGIENVGGFFGMNMGAIITSSSAVTTDLRYSSGDINLEGEKYIGGFGGANMAQAKLISNYAIGHIKGTDTVGGFLGLNVGKVEDAYSKGNVIGDITTSYLIGNNTGEVLNSFFHEEDSENNIAEIYELKSTLNGGHLDSWWATLNLGRRESRAIPYLLRWVDNSFDPEIRRKSLYALGMIGDTSYRSNIEDKKNIKPGNYVTPDKDDAIIYEYPNQNSYEKDELSFGSALVIGEKKKNNQDWLFIYDVNVTMGDYSIDNFVSGWVLKKQVKPAFKSYVSSILDKMNYIDKGYENAKVILSDREVLLKPNSDSEIKLEIPRGTGIEVIEENFPSPSMEIGGRGGIQTYDKIEIIESGVSGWIPRAGDQLPPFF